MLRENKWIIIAAHKTVREFHAKSLLAYVLANKGYNVILGRTGYLTKFSYYLPKGIYLDVAIVATRRLVFKKHRKNRFKVVAFCEEATALTDSEYASKRVDQEALTLTDAFFAWSERHADIIKQAVPEQTAKIHVTGHPRYDLLKEKLRGIYNTEVAGIRARHGRFILLNSNSGDHVLDMAKQNSLWESYVERKLYKPDEKVMFEQAMEYRRSRHRALMSILPEIRKVCPDHKIILRPHFMESERVLRDYLPPAFKDIDIIHEGSVIPWILAADVMIHSNCSTGIEAYLLGKPSISYRGVIDERQDSELANAASVEAYDPESFREALNDAVIRKKPFTSDNKKSEILAKNLFQDNANLSSDLISGIIDQIDHPRNSKAKLYFNLLIVFILGRIFSIKKAVRHFLHQSGSKSNGDTEEMTLNDLNSYMDQFQNVLRRGPVRTNALLPEVFIVRRSDD